MTQDREDVEGELRKIVQRYRDEINRTDNPNSPEGDNAKSGQFSSREYLEFRNEYVKKKYSLYENLCEKSEKILKLKPDEKTERVLEENIRISHLNVTPIGAYDLTILAPIVILVVGVFVGLALFQSMFMMLFFLILAAFSMFILQKLPEYVANSWRMSASNQMVVCIFYVATYMRHTPNLENAIEFAAEHIAPPLSIDLKKVLWDIETERYSSIKESLDNYLESWRKWNLEFIEAFHLIEASLYEKGDERRLILIDKALDVILQETYEKMLHYAYNLKNPITMLHMLGVILPILGLVILPLAVSFMDGIKWYYIALLYNFILPLVVFFLGKNIMSTRPTGYGDTDISENNPELKKFKNMIIRLGRAEITISPLLIAIVVGGLLLTVGLLPVIIHGLNPTLKIDPMLMEYKTSKSGLEIIGPYGIGAAVISVFVAIAAGIGLSIYFGMKSNNIIKIREESKELEKEFASGLFQLGNRIGDGIPAEMAFGSVAQVMQDTRSGEFFTIVNNNITKLGMNVENAIFDKKNGALVYFPSNVIESSMKVLLQSAQKGPLICSQALITISQYIKEIHRVDERLKDLLADIISSMKSQISFMAPAIAGVVVGITSMINTILGALAGQLNSVSSQMGGTDVSAGAGPAIPMMFGDGIPTYYFQIVVGIYVVQIVYILTVLANGVENGADKLSEDYLLGQNLRNSTLLYCIISTIVMVIFNTIAYQILPVLGSTQ